MLSFFQVIKDECEGCVLYALRAEHRKLLKKMTKKASWLSGKRFSQYPSNEQVQNWILSLKL